MDQYAEITVFLSVVEEGSFSAAGRKLGLSPSAVSKSISRLERRLNVRLFERIGGAIRLTHEGERFHMGSVRVVQAMVEAESSVTVTAADLTGTVRIHTALTTAKYLIAPALPLLMERHPKLRLDFMLGTERCDFVKQGIDLAIHSGKPTELALIGRPLALRPWVIAAAPTYIKRFGAPEQPEDLQRHRCLNFSIRTQWNEWTFRNDSGVKTIDIQSHIASNQGELLRSLALHGLGIVRLAQFHIADDLQAGKLIPLLEGFVERTEEDRFYLLYPHGKMLAPRVRAVVDFMIEQFSP